MSDSRSWGAMMEDEIKTCQFGVTTKYFDTCRCTGCEALRNRSQRIDMAAKKVYNAALKVYRETPDEQWKNIKSIKVPNDEFPDVADTLHPSDYM